MASHCALGENAVDTDPSTTREDRRHWMGVLAKASPQSLEALFDTISERPEFRYLRPPETGMVMVRGRQDDDAVPFNIGEMTVTRCSVEIAGGFVGTAYVMGCDRDHARRAALMDAMLQTPSRRKSLMANVIGPLAERRRQRQAERNRDTASTRVEFFTMTRGE